MKICLDAGHYGKYNQSPCNGAYYESDMTWKLHLLLKHHLEAYGIQVVTTRKNQETDRKLYDRGAAAKGCSLFISLHSNAAQKESITRSPTVPSTAVQTASEWYWQSVWSRS